MPNARCTQRCFSHAVLATPNRVSTKTNVSTEEHIVMTSQNDTLEKALGLLGYREELPSHYRSNLLHAIQQYAGLSGNQGLEDACEARLSLIRVENEAVSGARNNS